MRNFTFRISNISTFYNLATCEIFQAAIAFGFSSLATLLVTALLAVITMAISQEVGGEQEYIRGGGL